MGDNVININNHRKPKPTTADPAIDWFFDLRAWNTEGGVQGQITDSNINDGLSSADRLRKIAAAMDYLSYLLFQQAEDIESSEYGDPLLKITVFENSAVRIRLNDAKVETDAQTEWLADRLDDAKAECRSMVGSAL